MRSLLKGDTQEAYESDFGISIEEQKKILALDFLKADRVHELYLITRRDRAEKELVINLHMPLATEGTADETLQRFKSLLSAVREDLEVMEMPAMVTIVGKLGVPLVGANERNREQVIQCVHAAFGVRADVSVNYKQDQEDAVINTLFILKANLTRQNFTASWNALPHSLPYFHVKQFNKTNPQPSSSVGALPLQKAAPIRLMLLTEIDRQVKRLQTDIDRGKFYNYHWFHCGPGIGKNKQHKVDVLNKLRVLVNGDETHESLSQLEWKVLQNKTTGRALSCYIDFPEQLRSSGTLFLRA